ncbi:PH domain-containing protein [Actinoplanes rectilineatus]|uniref:PH domain-containing protein n=1 Tax=Actinoplanes rectilineatus TaxID=113571 RepID=UPI0005F2D5EE|nr:PH domain-containing protein [Actinoplanes rectilineatus]
MAFPDDVLSDEEELVLHLRPHWRASVAPLLVLALTVTGTVMALVLLPPTEGGRIGLLLVVAVMLWYGVRYALHPLLAWRCTHYVFTDERILLQDGVLARERRDLPLNRVNDHALHQSLLDRMLGSGTLTVDSIGEQKAVLAGVPDAQQVQSLLYELIEHSPAEDEQEDELSEDPALGPPH